MERSRTAKSSKKSPKLFKSFSRSRSLGWKSGYGINDAVYRTLEILCEK